MLHHVSLGTDDADRAAAFYDPVLAVLGLRKLQVRDGSVDYGCSMFEFSLEKPTDGRPASVGNGVHVAFAAGSRKQVRASSGADGERAEGGRANRSCKFGLT